MATATIVEFDSERVARYVEDAFAGFLKDPADTDYQRGYLASILTLYRECLNKGLDDHRLKLLDAQVRG